MLYSRDSLPQLIEALKDSDTDRQHEGMVGIGKVLNATGTAEKQEVVDSGILPKVMECLRQ